MGKAVVPTHVAVKGPLLASVFSLVGLPESAGGPPCEVAASPEGLGFDRLDGQVPGAAALFLARLWPRLQLFLGVGSSLASALVACDCWYQVSQRSGLRQ